MATRKTVKYDADDGSDPDDGWHPSGDTSCRFALDAVFRDYGFRIKYRRAGKEAIWEKDGKIYRQHQVPPLLPRRAVEDALYAEDLGRRGKMAG